LRIGIETPLKDLPGDLIGDAAALVSLLLEAEGDVLALATACSLELAEAEREKRIWTVEGAKSVDYTVISKRKLHDWEDMVSGAKWVLVMRLAIAFEARLESRTARISISPSDSATETGVRRPPGGEEKRL
jgi:hypothetical protein